MMSDEINAAAEPAVFRIGELEGSGAFAPAVPFNPGDIYEFADGGVIRNGFQYIPEDTENADYRKYLAWRDNGGQTAPKKETGIKTQYTPKQFMDRFTQVERHALILSEDINVKEFVLYCIGVQEVIPDHPQTVAGMAYLISQGYITEERKNEILGS